MSLVAEIYLLPHGNQSQKRLLQTLRLNLTGTEYGRQLGHYDAFVSHASSYKGDGTLEWGIWRTGKVERHDRRLSPAHLVLAGLRACLGYTPQDMAELVNEEWVPCERVLPAKPGFYLGASCLTGVVGEMFFNGETWLSPGNWMAEVPRLTHEQPTHWREMPKPPNVSSEVRS